MEETITISRKEYENLLKRDEILQALRETGVDSWTGYPEAMELLKEWNKDEK